MNVYRVTRTVEVQAESPEDAVINAAVIDMTEPSVVLQVRQEPFDLPSPMWDASFDPYFRLRRLR